MNSELEKMNNNLYGVIRQVLESARKSAYKAVNFAMVQAYWQIGRLIVENEQNGENRAEYGKKVLEELAKRLTVDFGKGFDASNLRYMRLFYKAFTNCDALRHELSWTHYRLLLRVENQEARNWYMKEAAAENWSSRQLERQISVLYYDRMLLSADKESTKADDNPTLGIVLCSNRNEAIVKYSVLNESKQLFASKYLLYLPTEDELKKEIERERKLLDEAGANQTSDKQQLNENV